VEFLADSLQGKVENLDIGVPISRIILYMAPPSLVPGFICRHKNHRDPDALKTSVQPHKSVPIGETVHGTSFLGCIEQILVMGFSFIMRFQA
jgi:hypothetical protein